MEICRRYVKFLSFVVSFLFALFITTKVKALLFVLYVCLRALKAKMIFLLRNTLFLLECIKLRSQIYLINQFLFNSCRTCRKFTFRLLKCLFTLRLNKNAVPFYYNFGVLNQEHLATVEFEMFYFPIYF